MKFKNLRNKQVAIMRVCRKGNHDANSYRELWGRKITNTMAEIFTIVHVKDHAIGRINMLDEGHTPVIVTIDPEMEIGTLGNNIHYFTHDLKEQIPVQLWNFTFTTKSKYHDRFVSIYNTYEKAREEFIRNFGEEEMIGPFPSIDESKMLEKGLKLIYTLY